MDDGEPCGGQERPNVLEVGNFPRGYIASILYSHDKDSQDRLMPPGSHTLNIRHALRCSTTRTAFLIISTHN